MSVTGHSDVDMESASAFSPSEPSVDGVFVSKHNQSAEMYQMFKEDVDSLLSGRTPQHEQPVLIQRILHTCENMYVVFEDEKQHLMGDVLLSWAMKQQKTGVRVLQQRRLRESPTMHSTTCSACTLFRYRIRQDKNFREG
ncbi:hypothetical protein NECAME_15369 [Necator americanus]|uniref:Signal transducer and activator of transcription b N-terminal domain-containing protein n=1 Tax=Necator americanus TaxID=51031 RepID=W2SKI6_NECAM|nr:hypothetical protein NECAME_15369 [Necator americanus]ETN69351.1 hypothetical protein NECAME_15369 [Necator americanus]